MYSVQEMEEHVMDYMQRFPGKKVHMWDIVRQVTEILSTDGLEKSEVKKVVSKALNNLIKGNKIKRYQENTGTVDGKRKRENLIRINEAYVIY